MGSGYAEGAITGSQSVARTGYVGGSEASAFYESLTDYQIIQFSIEDGEQNPILSIPRYLYE
jgi:hypothetical protein